jgi:O-antigen/teichoic acid export membrane protein
MWPSEKILFGILALLFFLGHSLQEKLSATYNGILKYRLFIKISSFFLFVQIVILALNYYFDIFINVFAPIICIIIVTLIQSIVLFYSLFSTNRKGFKGIKSVEWKAYLGFAIPAYMANLIQFLATRSDLWLINYFYNKSEVGYYAFATKIGGLLLFLPILLASILFPLLTSEKVKYESLEKIIKVTNTVLLIVSIPAIVSAIVFIPMIWGDKYLNAIWPFIILLPGYIAQSQTTLYAAFFASISRIKTNMTNSIITFCVFMILSIQFIPEYGIIGAAISLTTANIMGAIWIIRKYNQVTGSLSMRLFLGKQDFIILKQILFK